MKEEQENPMAATEEKVKTGKKGKKGKKKDREKAVKGPKKFKPAGDAAEAVASAELATKEKPAKEKKPAEIKRREFTRNLRVNLTTEKKLHLAGQLADEHNSLESLDKERKDVAASFKAKIEERRSGIKTLSLTLANGYEYEPVKCEEEKDFAASEVRCRRLDTGEVFERRRMTDADRQVNMFDEELPADEEVAEADGVEEDDVVDDVEDDSADDEEG